MAGHNEAARWSTKLRIRTKNQNLNGKGRELGVPRAQRERAHDMDAPHTPAGGAQVLTRMGLLGQGFEHATIQCGIKVEVPTPASGRWEKAILRYLPTFRRGGGGERALGQFFQLPDC